MATLTTRIGPQLKALEGQIKRFIRSSLLATGRRMRSRMLREWLSKPKGTKGPGVSRKTGKTQRSQRYRVFVNPASIKLRQQIGGGPAWYVEKLERFGKIQFRKTFAEEAQRAVSQIQSGIQFFMRSFGRPSSAPVPEDTFALAPDRAALFGQLSQHFEVRKLNARARRIERKTNREALTAFEAGGGTAALQSALSRLVTVRGGQ